MLPVAFGSEAIAITHQHLSSQARQLFEPLEVLEVGAESVVTSVIEEFLDGNVFAELIAYRCLEFFLRVVLRIERVHFSQFLVFRIDVSFRNSIYLIHEFTDRPIVNRPAELNLSFYFITFGNSYVTHGITETADADMEAFVVSYSYILPISDFLLDFLVTPVAINNLVVNVQTGVKIAVFTVAMSTLVEVHVIKVNRSVGNFVEILGSQMQERFLQEFRAANPVLGRREGVHPGDDTSYFIMVVDILHELRDAISRGHNAFADDLIRQFAAGIEFVHNVLRVTFYIFELFFTIEMLAACNKPKFIIFYFQH